MRHKVHIENMDILSPDSTNWTHALALDGCLSGKSFELNAATNQQHILPKAPKKNKGFLSLKTKKTYFSLFVVSDALGILPPLLLPMLLLLLLFLLLLLVLLPVTPSFTATASSSFRPNAQLS